MAIVPGPCFERPDDLGTCCDCWDQIDPELQDQSWDFAAAVIWNLTQRRYGCCEVTVRPCFDPGCGPVSAYGPVPGAGQLAGRWTPALIDGKFYNVECGCPADGCACSPVCEVMLEGPVCEVLEVREGPRVLHPWEYRVDNENYLVRQYQPRVFDPPGSRLRSAQDLGGFWCDLVGVQEGNSSGLGPAEPDGCRPLTSVVTAFDTEPRWEGTWRSDIGGTSMSVFDSDGDERLLPEGPMVTGVPIDSIGYANGTETYGARWTLLEGTAEVASDGRITVPSGTRLRLEWVGRGPGCWPDCNEMRETPGEEGVWTVTYTMGQPLPSGGALAIGALACEIAKSCDPQLGSCRLPERVQSITREGVSMIMVDSASDLMEHGLTGIPRVDLWLRSLKGKGRRRRIQSADRALNEVRRRTTWSHTP